MIKYCGCTSSFGRVNGCEYQNERYGYGNRVHNKGANGKYCCTVCGKTSLGTVAKKGIK